MRRQFGVRRQTGLGREGSKGSEGKVDGPPGRRLWPPVGGRLCSLRSGGDSACGAEGGGLPLRAMLIKSALRIYLSVSYGMIGILRIDSLRSPPLIRLRRTSPRESVSHDSQVALLPYESCSLATPMQGAE